MKAKDEARLSRLRMVKSAVQLKTVEKMSPLDDKESQAVLSTLIKTAQGIHRTIHQGGRQEMADKEAAEITVIETYLPKAASEADIAAGVKATIAETGASHHERNGHGHEERHGKIQRRRHARRWEDGQRSREERTGREVATPMWGQPPSAVRRAQLDGVIGG